MRSAVVLADGSRVRWVESPGADGPVRVYLHGLGASSPTYFAAAAAHPALAGPRAVLIDLLGFGLSDRPADFDHTLEAHAAALDTALDAAGCHRIELVAHSMGGSIGILLAAARPGLVTNLVLVDANLDPADPLPGAGNSRGIAAYDEDAFVAASSDGLRAQFGDTWWATMQWADRAAVHRSAVSLIAPRTPSLRSILQSLPMPRTFLHPDVDGPPTDVDGLRVAGVDVVAVPDCDHNIMLDNVDGFATSTARALSRR